ncbi:MAG: membrane protein insertion efficiency factor YidD [Candidatus Peribacteraceae bacterium]|nr:membrane protein insertion efficiency factor YidD [Candidatus Peribacteraceae bacterium]
MRITVPRRLALVVIGLYQKTISPDHGPLRRFFPGGVCMHEETCSEYGKRMIVSNGVILGSVKTLKRILHCGRGLS